MTQGHLPASPRSPAGATRAAAPAADGRPVADRPAPGADLPSGSADGPPEPLVPASELRDALIAARRAELDAREAMHEIRRIRGEIRYRLGSLLVDTLTSRSPGQWARLPVRLWRLWREGLARRRARRRIDTREEDFSPAPFVRRTDIRMAVVCDSFSYQCWKYEVQTIPVRADRWQEALDASPHLLLVEATWRGPGHTWRHQIEFLENHPAGPRANPLARLVAAARNRGIPTLFYAKEDPPHFATFIEAARLFDFVLTSDEDCLPRYHERLGHDRIAVCPFAAQVFALPANHDPASRDRRPAFAGTYYAHRYPGRQIDMQILLEPAVPLGLVIYDRMAGTDNPNYHWPAVLAPAVVGALPYADMIHRYARHRIFLNVNSVTDSPTMCARRVFEILACGTPLVSTPSRAIPNLLGDVVPIVTTREQARWWIERLLTDDALWMELSTRGRHAVLAAHTCSHRMEMILALLGLPTRTIDFLRDPPQPPPLARATSLPHAQPRGAAPTGAP